MTLAELQKREKLLTAAITKAFNAALKRLRDELHAEKSQFKYLGTFNRERSYVLGNFVTHKGGMWHCNRVTQGELPGDGSDAWTLAVKSGKE
jgi:hypothetical protein